MKALKTETRNQSRKRLYAAQAAAAAGDGSKRATKRLRLKGRRNKKFNPAAQHAHPCGNFACVPCRAAHVRQVTR